MKHGLRLVIAGAALLLAQPAQADFEIGSEGFAPVPSGAIAWTVLGATEVEPWTTPAGVTHLAPRFPADVEALDGHEIAVAGYMVPLEDGAGVRHFALYASKVDCELHLPPGPNAYVDVTTRTPLTETEAPLLVSGKLTLVRAREGGVFFRIADARVSPDPAPTKKTAAR